jgi:hypothetical protein
VRTPGSRHYGHFRFAISPIAIANDLLTASAPILSLTILAERPLTHTIDDLLEICLALRASGADFPTIWNKVLQHSRLVVGRPIQFHEGGRPLLKIQLVTNQYLLFSAGRFSVEGRRGSRAA